MIEETGVVVAVEPGIAWVETQRKSACQACSVSKGCGTSVLAKTMGGRRNKVRVLNPINAKLNEEVVVGLGESAMLSGALAVYVVPLLAMVVGALLGQVVASEYGMQNADGLTALFGFAGLALGFLWLRHYGKRTASDERYQPVILRRVACEAPLLRLDT